MSDIFISYKREDQLRVMPLVDLLKNQGWAVFWDQEIPPGENWRSWITQNIFDSRCLIVAWSELSINSRWVVDEVDDAKAAGKPIFPVMLDDVQLPLGLRAEQAVDLSQWDKSAVAPVATKLLEGLTRKLGLPPIMQQKPKLETTNDVLADVSAAAESQSSKHRHTLELLDNLKLAQDNLRSNDPRVKKVAAEQFGAYATEESLEGLVELLHDDDEAVKTRAREVLLRPDYVKDLIDADIDFIKKANEQCKNSAISDLEFLNLLPISNNEETFHYASQNIWHEDPETQCKAASILGEIGNTNAILPLRELLHEPNAAVVRSAKTALIRLADKITVDLVVDVGKYEELTEALTDPSPKLVDLLCDKMAESYKQRTPIIELVRQAGSLDKFIDALLVRFDKDDDKIRNRAISLLSQIGDTRAVEPLLSLIEDTSLSIDLRTQAIRTVGKLEDERAVEPLIKILNDKLSDFENRSRRKNFEGFKDGYWERLESESEFDHAVIIALGRLKDPRAIDPLIRFKARFSRHELAVVWAWGYIGDPKAVDSIASIVSPGDTRFDEQMVNALVAIGGPRAIDALHNHLEAPQGRGPYGEKRDFYLTLMTGLEKIGDLVAYKQGIDAIKAHLQDDDEDVRLGAKEALKQLEEGTRQGKHPPHS